MGAAQRIQGYGLDQTKKTIQSTKVFDYFLFENKSSLVRRGLLLAIPTCRLLINGLLNSRWRCIVLGRCRAVLGTFLALVVLHIVAAEGPDDEA